MKITVTCLSCERTKEPARTVEEISELYFQVPYQESAFYDVLCPRGHNTRFIYDAPRHEMLFEAGINALNDGYYREAVSSFAVALERFYEYAIRVILTSLIEKVGSDVFDNTWKLISKQSERQIGAFYLLYLNVFHQLPVAFDVNFLKQHKLKLSSNNDPVNFRNRVVHQGFIPTYEQSLVFGEAVNFYIRAGLKQLFSADFNVFAPMLADNTAASLFFKPEDEKFSQGQGSCFLSINHLARIMDMASFIEFMDNNK
jgi:hypothetical protein